MSRTEENFILFLFGGVLYSLIEILFRGFTHWSMTITGGICLVVLYRQFTNKPDSPLFLKCLFGSAVITGFEFAVGCIVNLILDWNVWDYSSHPLNLMGQICPLFSALWFLLTIPVIWLCSFFHRRFSETKQRTRTV